ncbi:MAG: hypothetical protein HY238_21180 [Acidobacteria bacterium]|nr:hypothetical protein [Acidobacteriota bacterium]
MTATVFSQDWIVLPEVRVVDLWGKPQASGAAEALQRALEGGLPADPDPRRPNFYEASFDGYRYYFNVLPGRPAKVFLLARWPVR